MDYENTKKLLQTLGYIKQASDKKGVKFWLLGGLACAFQAGSMYREFADIDLIVKNKEDYYVFCELMKNLNFKKIREKRLSKNLVNSIYENLDEIEVDIGPNLGEFGIIDADFEDNERELKGVRCFVMSKKYLINFLKKFKKNNLKNKSLDLKILERINGN